MTTVPCNAKPFGFRRLAREHSPVFTGPEKNATDLKSTIGDLKSKYG